MICIMGRIIMEALKRWMRSQFTPLVILCASLVLPLCFYYEEIPDAPVVTRYSLWNWLYCGITLVVCVLLCFAAWLLCYKRSAPLVFGKVSAVWVLLLSAVAWSVCFNPFIMCAWPQLPYCVLFLLGAWFVLRAILGRFAFIVWIPCLIVLLLEYIARHEGILLTAENLAQVFVTSWRDAKEFVTPETLSAFGLIVSISCFSYWLVDKQLRYAKRETLFFDGMVCLCILFVGIKPLALNMTRNNSLIWPLGDIEVLAYRVAQAQREIHQADHLIDCLPMKERASATSDVLADVFEVVVLLHVGESLCADHMSVNGYARPTTPWLASQKGVISFNDCVASADLTDKAVVTMLTNGRRNFLKTDTACYLPSSAGVMDYFSACDFRCSYAYTDGLYNSNSLTLFNRQMKFLLRCANDCISSGADAWTQAAAVGQYIGQHPGERLFIMLSNAGSHIYFSAYDKEHPPFKPVRPGTPNDSPEKDSGVATLVTNAYDCTVHYTDESIRRLLEPLKGKPYLYIYMSDHGEYVGQGGYWLRLRTPHDAFYRTSVCQVGFVIIASPEFEAMHPHFKEALAEVRKHQGMSVAHEHLFHTVLGIMGIRTPFYDASLDLSNPQVQPYTGPHPSRGGAPQPGSE